MRYSTLMRGEVLSVCDFLVEMYYLVAAAGRIEVWLVTVSSTDQIYHPVFVSFDTAGLALVV
ncbi:hypothetical protein E2C01_099940 [Portunus trituberculatus]|uniref:Uncharacterized protein n=1 Tax=Portunus trituberculatus TaxID=210409 RepID=A0A5B7K1N8_PORTR|nr:hypothetical protein [Portunus trituberculatus]